MKNPQVNPSPDLTAMDPSARESTIYSKVIELIRLLQNSKRRIVLAESCTGGLLASWIASVPGVSEVFCGSMVVYRNDTKSQWLGVDPALLANPGIGPVSSQASEQLASEVLSRTPEADCSLSITGHFGPNAPADLNLRIYMGWCEVQGEGPGAFAVSLQEGRLSLGHQEQASEDSGQKGDSERLQALEAWERRRFLQLQAVEMLLDFALGRLKNLKTDKSGRIF